MKKQPEVTEKTKQTFIDVFCELYSQKPIEKISVQELSNKAGFNRSTFYQYFNDIYELLIYVENDVLDYLRDTMNNTNTTPLDIVRFFVEKGDYLSALLGDYGNIRFVEKLKTEIALDERRCIFSKDSAMKDSPLAPYLIEFHVSTSLSLLGLWQRRQKDLAPEELFDLISTLFTNGISAIPFHEVKGAV